jgi:hypothetical protein
MKQYLIVAIALLLMTCTVHAQGVHPGLKGGLNVYNVLGNQPTNYVPKFSYHFGALTHFHVTDHFAVQPEVIYSAQGARYENSSLDLRLKYVNVPVLAQYMFGNGFRLQAGPQVGIMASAKTEINGEKTNVENLFESADFGATAGLSFVRPETGLGFDVRYNQGFTDITSGPFRSYNSGLQVGLFYLFGHEY